MNDSLKLDNPSNTWKGIAMLCAIIASIIVGVAIGYKRPIIKQEPAFNNATVVDSMKNVIKTDCKHAFNVVVWPDGEITLLRYLSLSEYDSITQSFY